MALAVDFLEVRDFRNYEWFLLQLDRGTTIISGRNAAGKTNLIEAMRILTAGESFRICRWDEVVRHEATMARISVTARGDDRELSIVMDMERGARRAYHINGSKKRSVSAAVGGIPSVLFTPDDLSLAKKGPEERRGPVDSLGSQMSATYDSLRKDYARVLRQKNALLRDEGPQAEIDTWTEALVSTGSRLMIHRERLVDRLSEHFVETYEEISDGEKATMRYVPSWERDAGDVPAQEGEREQQFREHVSRSRDEERARRTSVIGPHRDDIELKVDGSNARLFASQGQQRTAALAWKLAEVAVVQEVLGRNPLLLLDDVMSELDHTRRKKLLEHIGGSIQTVVTTTNLQYFSDEVLASSSVVVLDEAV